MILLIVLNLIVLVAFNFFHKVQCSGQTQKKFPVAVWCYYKITNQLFWFFLSVDFLEVIHSFLQGFIPPLNLSQKSYPPFCFSSLNFKNSVHPLFVVPPPSPAPHWFIIFKFPPTKIFNLYIAGLHKRTSNTVST